MSGAVEFWKELFHLSHAADCCPLCREMEELYLTQIPFNCDEEPLDCEVLEDE